MTTEIQAPGTQPYLALERAERDFPPPTCEAESFARGDCTNQAAWGVSLGHGAGLACDPCKTEIDQARFGKPAGLQWVRL